MPNFDIVRVNTPDITYRVAKVQADYDVKLEHSCEHFVGSIDIPDDDKWHIGLIVGGERHRQKHYCQRAISRYLCEWISLYS